MKQENNIENVIDVFMNEHGVVYNKDGTRISEKSGDYVLIRREAFYEFLKGAFMNCDLSEEDEPEIQEYHMDDDVLANLFPEIIAMPDGKNYYRSRYFIKVDDKVVSFRYLSIEMSLDEAIEEDRQP